MSKQYVCDCCGEILFDPHKVKMKEFYIDLDYDYLLAFIGKHRKTKINLCADCFSALKEIGGRIRNGRSITNCQQLECKNMKDGQCYYPLFGDCIISQVKKYKTIEEATRQVNQNESSRKKSICKENSKRPFIKKMPDMR